MLSEEDKAHYRARLEELDARASSIDWRDGVATWVPTSFCVLLYGSMTAALWIYWSPWAALIPVGFVAYLFALVYFGRED